MVYNIFDIFMIMFYGNEIMVASDRLSYYLYESNWIDRSQSIKKNVLMFGELLMQPHMLVVMNTFPLTLKTFMKVENMVYNTEPAQHDVCPIFLISDSKFGV